MKIPALRKHSNLARMPLHPAWIGGRRYLVVVRLRLEAIFGYPNNDRKLNKVGISFDNTGVVSGEFGMVEAHRAKKVAMEEWLADPRATGRRMNFGWPTPASKASGLFGG